MVTKPVEVEMPTLPEWILIVLILAIVFSVSRLGDLGDAIGRAVQGRRRG